MKALGVGNCRSAGGMGKTRLSTKVGKNAQISKLNEMSKSKIARAMRIFFMT